MAKKSRKTNDVDEVLERARLAVEEARLAVKKLDKKTRREAQELADALHKAIKDAKKAVRRLEHNTQSGSARDALISLSTMVTPGASAALPATVAATKKREKTAPSTSTTSEATSYAELREKAKALGITGYSRLTKSELHERITHAEAKPNA